MKLDALNECAEEYCAKDMLHDLTPALVGVAVKVVLFAGIRYAARKALAETEEQNPETETLNEVESH
jgi:hypothetical protein